MTGTIKSYSKEKGYGFIVNDNKDYFFRYTDVLGKDYKVCAKGKVVEFEPKETIKGLRATNVR